MSRYNSKIPFTNDNEFYKTFFEQREVKSIKQFSTPKLKNITQDQISSLSTISHIWSTGDRYSKLAYDHYGDSRLWWVIAWFNKKPTESHLEYGDLIYIPHPLERILDYMGV